MIAVGGRIRTVGAELAHLLGCLLWCVVDFSQVWAFDPRQIIVYLSRACSKPNRESMVVVSICSKKHEIDTKVTLES